MSEKEIHFDGKTIRKSNIRMLGLSQTHDPNTSFDWVLHCRAYGNKMLYEAYPTLRDAIERLHIITSLLSDQER